MRATAISIMVCSAWSLALPAQATLIANPALAVRNQCGHEIAIAVRYKTGTGWATTSFVNVKPRATRERVASSNNRVFYYYAESLSGNHKWRGDKQVMVEGKSYGMKEKTLTLDTERNRFLLTLSCGS